VSTRGVQSGAIRPVLEGSAALCYTFANAPLSSFPSIARDSPTLWSGKAWIRRTFGRARSASAHAKGSKRCGDRWCDPAEVPWGGATEGSGVLRVYAPGPGSWSEAAGVAGWPPVGTTGESLRCHPPCGPGEHWRAGLNPPQRLRPTLAGVDGQCPAIGFPRQVRTPTRDSAREVGLGTIFEIVPNPDCLGLRSIRTGRR